MIKCDKHSIDEHAFEELNDNKSINFFPWTDFLSCDAEQRTTIVQRINQWRNNYRSMLIHGFKDNDNNVPMYFNESGIENDPLMTTSVTEYLANYIKDVKGNKLFQHVYAPQYGIREAIVQLHNFSQAASFIKVAHGELARNMDREAMERVFINPRNADSDSNRNTWRPNSRVSDIPPTLPKEKYEFNTKRMRTSTDTTITTRPSTDKTYSSITLGTKHNTKPNTTSEIDEFKSQIKSSVEAQMREMKNQINETQSAVVNLESKMEYNSITTNNTVVSMKLEVQLQINDLKTNMIETKNDIKGYGETLDKLTVMLASMNKKMDYNYNIEQNCTKSKAQKHKLDTDEGEDINMLDSKQHGGTRVTRLSANNQ
jgi:hypothetical protein